METMCADDLLSVLLYLLVKTDIPNWYVIFHLIVKRTTVLIYSQISEQPWYCWPNNLSRSFFLTHVYCLPRLPKMSCSIKIYHASVVLLFVVHGFNFLFQDGQLELHKELQALQFSEG